MPRARLPRKSQSRRQADAHRRSRDRLKKYVPWAIVGAVGLLIGGAILYSLLFIENPDSGAGFRVQAYQGEDEIGGAEINFQDLLDQGKPVVLNFWAGLCPPCRQEMPGFQRVYEDHRGEFILIGVDVGPFLNLGNHDDAREFLEEFDITYPTGFALTDNPIQEYEVLSMPKTVFFTSEGFIFFEHSGFLSEDLLREQIDALLMVSEESGG